MSSNSLETTATSQQSFYQPASLEYEKMSKLYSDKRLNKCLTQNCLFIINDGDDFVDERIKKSPIKIIKFNENKKLIVEDLNITQYIETLLG
jgi:hypothetical protein